MTALKKPPSWDEAKKALGDSGFMDKLLNFNKDTLDDTMIKKLTKFTGNQEFTPESVGKVSGAARGMCLWVHAMKVRCLTYFRIPFVHISVANITVHVPLRVPSGCGSHMRNKSS
jgi:hypothetical protein